MRSGQSTVGRPADRRVLHAMRMTGVAGSESHLLELARELRSLGWRTDAVIGTPDAVALRAYARDLARAGGGRVALVSMRGDLSPAFAWALRRRLRRDPPDVLHTHLVHADWYGALAAMGTAVPVVSTKHNHDPFRTLPVFRRVERAAARRADAVIAISDSLADFTRRHAGVPCTVVRYGLATGRPAGAPADGRPYLLAVGRLERQKGLDVLLAAFAVVAERHPDLDLLIAGDGGEREALRERAEALGIAGRVALLGWRDDVDRLLAGSVALTHPARWEGFGLVLLEAMRQVRPVVATTAGAIPEVVRDGVTGLLVAPEDPGGLATAILRVVEDPGLAERLGRAGRDRLERAFLPARMAAETVVVYERAARCRSGAAGSGQVQRPELAGGLTGGGRALA